MDENYSGFFIENSINLFFFFRTSAQVYTLLAPMITRFLLVVVGGIEWQELVNFFNTFFKVVLPGYLGTAYLDTSGWKERDKEGRIQTDSFF